MPLQRLSRPPTESNVDRATSGQHRTLSAIPGTKPQRVSGCRHSGKRSAEPQIGRSPYPTHGCNRPQEGA